ncbi:hypothetical protein ACDF64_04975 [Agromyces sp. MMS24-JH15]|uniref:hypothetical protein n=1 Tax=Agromyces sp. MMS24-JH15 TaxID=3243765 RepID=UPI0037494E9D
MGYVLAVIVWGIVGAVPGAIVGALVYAVAWLYNYGEAAPTSPWWFWGPVAVGAVIGALNGLGNSGSPGRLEHFPERGTIAWQLDEIRRNTEPPSKRSVD